MTTLTPYLLFLGNCAEAMECYRACFGGQLSVTRVADSPMAAQMPPTVHDRVVHAQLTSGRIEISASDWMHPTRPPVQGNTVCLYISGPMEELRSYFDALSIGATAVDAFTPMPFGSYGALTDRFGVRWMFRGGTA
jgi:PhnB protein